VKSRHTFSAQDHQTTDSLSVTEFGKITARASDCSVMKWFEALFLVIAFVMVAAGQNADDVLATSVGRTFTIRDLPAETQQAVSLLPTRTFASRTAILDQLINQRLIAAEAKALGISPGKFLADEKAKVANPGEAEIKAVYDANRQALGDLTLEQARRQIISFLRREPEQKALGILYGRLKTKYKFIVGRAVNSANLSPTDVVATVNAQPVTAKEYEEFAKIELYELRASVGDLIMHGLDETIQSALIADEAKSLDIDAGTLIAREITNKLKDFSDEERHGLEVALQKRLAVKYKVNIVYKAPDPIIQEISIDDDPASGPTDAPVTVVMFSDFQCSACSATHPVLKKAISEYPGKIRFVVRDFPLESIHENAWHAALAAGAANLQGKFFEYTEVLYRNQTALDNASLKRYAAELGLNVKQFALDFNSAPVAAEVRKDMADGEAYVINSTPTIFVNGIRVRNISLDGFRTLIEKALSK
jgi:protein-disulfide isomerase